MNFDYIVLILIITGILGGFGFWKLIKHFKYELKFKEILLFSIPLLVLAILCLIDFRPLNINIDFIIIIGIIIIYFLALSMLYYIVSSIKLKKYVPIKLIIAYISRCIVFSGILLILLYNLLII